MFELTSEREFNLPRSRELDATGRTFLAKVRKLTKIGVSKGFESEELK